MDSENADPVTWAPSRRRRGVARNMSMGDYIVLDALNRRLVAGNTNRVSAMRTSVACGIVVVIVGASVIWIAGGPIGLLILFGGAVLTAAALFFELGKKECFEKHGYLLTGEVTKVEEARGWTFGYPPGMYPSYSLRISYRFLTPAGQERVGQVRFTSDDHPVPSAGDQLAILYADGIKERVM